MVGVGVGVGAEDTELEKDERAGVEDVEFEEDEDEGKVSGVEEVTVEVFAGAGPTEV